MECEGELSDGAVVKADCSVGERRELEDGWVGLGEAREEVEEPSVVLRCRFVVSAEGGGGSEERFGMAVGDSIVARQRKHSPVPK